MRIIRTLACAVVLLTGAVHAADDGMWDKLRAGGNVLFMRHTQTTGNAGDPPDFRLDDCSTQRNLNDQGRDEARRIGEALRARGVRVSEVLTSRWCRAIDTAKLAFGRHEVWSELNNTFDLPARRQAQISAIRWRISGFSGPDNLVMVGHGTNIQALTGIQPKPGAIVVLAPGGKGGFTVLGQIQPETLLDTKGGR